MKCHENRHVFHPAGAESVRMKPRSKNEVHSVPSHDDQRKSHNRRTNHSEVLDPATESSMQHRYITEQNDQGPSFLWIPTPEPTPAVIRPDATQNNTWSQEGNADLYRPI